MITVIETNDGSEEAYGWFRNKLYPHWTLEKTINQCTNYFFNTEARQFQFYEDGVHVGFLATTLGFTLHYPLAVNISSVTSPNANGNRPLLRAMLEQAKQVCREAGSEYLIRSIHLSPSVSRVITTKIKPGGVH